MKRQMIKLGCIAAGALSFGSVANAGYDAAGGYVTMVKDGKAYSEYDSPGMMSLTTTGAWSDGRAPHSDTNYYTTGLGVYAGTWMGGPIVVRKIKPRGEADSTWENLEANACVIPNLTFEDNDSSWICAYGSTKKLMFKGSMTLLNQAKIMPGHTESGKCGEYVFKMSLVGAASTKLIICADGSGSDKYYGKTYWIGDTDSFLGYVDVQKYMTLYLGDWGFGNATEVKLSDALAALDTYATRGVAVPISKLTTTAAAKIVFPHRNRWTVGTLELAANTVFDCGGISGDAVADAGIVVTQAVTLGGKIKVDLGGLSVLQRKTVRLLSVPLAVRTLTSNDFELLNVGADPNYTFEIVSEGGQSVAELNSTWPMSDLPVVFDATTGYVVQTNADASTGTVPYYSYDRNGINWSDGLVPHAGTNYFSNGKYLRAAGTNQGVFSGDRLALRGTLRIDSVSGIECADLWAVPNGNAGKVDCTQLTTAGSPSSFSVRGRLSVFTTEASPFSLIGGEGRAASHNGTPDNPVNTWNLQSTLLGAPSAYLLYCCHTTYKDPSVNLCHFVGTLSGDCSDYYGTVGVDWCCTFRLGAGGLPKGTLKIVKPDYGRVTSTNAMARTIPVKKLVAPLGVNLEPLAGNVFAFGSMVVTGVVTKTGAGTVAAGGTATVGNNARIDVREGRLCALSEEAFNGFAIDFADNAGFAVDIVNGAPLKTTGAVAAVSDATVKVDVLGLTRESPDQTVVLARVPTAYVAALAAAIRVGRIPGFKVSVPTVGAVGADGLSPISVDITKQGFVLLFR